MLKKLLLTTCCVMALTAEATVGHNADYAKSNLQQPEQIATFQRTPNSWLWYRNFVITTVYGVSDTAMTHSVYNDCLITPQDLQNSATDALPINAKIIGYQLDGYYDSQYSNVLMIYCWMKHTDQTSIEHTTVSDGWKKNGYLDGLTSDWQYCNGQTFTLPSGATEQSPKPLYDVTFDNGKVFQYEGRNILMSIRNRAETRKLIDFHYVCAPAVNEIAAFYRTGNYGYGGPATGGTTVEVDGMVSAESYQLPAFRWKYYTNDITVVVNLLDRSGNPIAQDDITDGQPDGRPLLYIYDETAKRIVEVQGVTRDADGFFAVTPGTAIEVKNVDYTHQYRIVAKSATCGQDEVLASFGSIDNDIDLTFTLQQDGAPAKPGDLTGDGNVDIADINALINVMLGQWTAADCVNDPDLTGDGKVDIADVNVCINLMLGIGE